MAALVAALVNFGVAWSRRNCLTTRFANEKQTAWLKQENAKLAEIDAKYDALRRKSATNSTPPTITDEN